jgi:hypothetical protein
VFTVYALKVARLRLGSTWAGAAMPASASGAMVGCAIHSQGLLLGTATFTARYGR